MQRETVRTDSTALSRMTTATASSRVLSCRLVVQQLVRPALQYAPVEVRRQMPTPGVHHQPQVQPPMALAPTKRLAQHADHASHTPPADERYAPGRERLPVRRHDEPR